MRSVWPFAAGLGLGMIVSACATGSFPFTSYGLDLKDQKLLASASSGAPDLPLSTCSPTPESISPCVVFMTPEYIAVKTGYEECQVNLVACEKAAK